jgi:hypothetical protein
VSTRPLAALAVTLCTLILLWTTANVADDRTVLIAPPHARAENFVRALMTHRAELVLDDLAPQLRRKVSIATLHERFDALDRQLGGVRQIEATIIFYDSAAATARVELFGASRVNLPLEFRFTWQQGEWILEELPSVLM